MSSSGAGADASDPDAALARLSGPDLVAHLRTTCRRADYDAVARVLADRDRRLAHAEAALARTQTELPDYLAEVEALRERYLELKAKEGRGPSSGAIAAAAPRVCRRAEERGPEERAVIDLCGSSSDDEEELEEGEFRPAGVPGFSCEPKEPAAASKGVEGRRAGVSCQRKEPAASKGEEERNPVGVSCKRKAPASSSSPDDEDDGIPLSQLFMKKRRRAHPVANGEPKKGRRDAQANSAGTLGVDRPVISPANRGTPEAVAVQMVVQGTGNDQSGKNGGLSRTMPTPPPTGSTAGKHNNCSKPDGSEDRARIGEKQGPVAVLENDAPNQVRTPIVTDTMRRIVGSARVDAERPMEHTAPPTGSTDGYRLHKNCSKPDGSGGRERIGEKQGPVAGPENDAPVQVRTPNAMDTVRRIVGSAHVGAERHMEHTDSSTDGIINVVLQSIEGQGKAIAGVHKPKVSVETSLPSEVTSLWTSSSAVLISCLGNKILCMQAACALHRQKTFTTQPTIQGITKYDAHRMAVLAEFLLDGNLQGPLKKTAEDLEKHDSTGHDFLERVVMHCSEQLFSIYRNKDDKYFR